MYSFYPDTRFSGYSIDVINKSKSPVVGMTPSAMAAMQAYVDYCQLEISWMGHITQKDNLYIIDDVYLPEQEVAPATCSLTERGLNKMMVDTIQNRGVDYYNEICVWGHSHVDMPTSPSGQDQKQILEWRDRDYFIMLILNKKGDVHCEFYDFKNNIAYKNVPIQIFVHDIDQIHSQARQDIKERVHKAKLPVYQGYGNPRGIANPSSSRQVSMFNGVSDQLSFRSYVLDYLKTGWPAEELSDLLDELEERSVCEEIGPDECISILEELPITDKFHLDNDVFRRDFLGAVTSDPDWLSQAICILDDFMLCKQYIEENEADAVSILQEVAEQMSNKEYQELNNAPTFNVLMTSITKQKNGKTSKPFCSDIHGKAIRDAMRRTLKESSLLEEEVIAMFLNLADEEK